MMQNHVIYSDDPQAVEKLQAKLDKLTAMHARMKEINAYFRKHATALGCPGLSDEDAAKLDRRVQEGKAAVSVLHPQRQYGGDTAAPAAHRGGIPDAKHRICGLGLSGRPCRSRQGG